ncbi:hypothetical protein WJX73_002515 [Symbiochloris irregularis]|uniref:Uncharacterized protein n=1 Tax=Symbiochloris irregularis TaxID=706552 RepID=A0AAW1Q2D8_9CHLO
MQIRGEQTEPQCFKVERQRELMATLGNAEGYVELCRRYDERHAEGTGSHPTLLATEVNTEVMECLQDKKSGLYTVSATGSDPWSIFLWCDRSMTHTLGITVMMTVLNKAFAQADGIARKLLPMAGEVMYEIAVQNEGDHVLLDELELLFSAERVQIALGLKIRLNSQDDGQAPQMALYVLERLDNSDIFVQAPLEFGAGTACLSEGLPQYCLKIPTAVFVKGTADEHVAQTHLYATVDLYALREKVFCQLQLDPTQNYPTPSVAVNVAEAAADWAKTSQPLWWGSEATQNKLESSRLASYPKVVLGQG